jgi:hypothetical protein
MNIGEKKPTGCGGLLRKLHQAALPVRDLP